MESDVGFKKSVDFSINKSFNIVRSILDDLKSQDSTNRDYSLIVDKALLELNDCIKENIGNPLATKEKIIKILGDVNIELIEKKNSLELTTSDKKAINLVNKIQKKILQAKRIIQTQPIVEIKEKKASIEIDFCFLCDIDSSDTNGAITQEILGSLTLESPFITSRAVFCGTKIEDEGERKKLIINIEKKLMKDREKWEIFRQSHPSFGQEFLIFLPKSKKIGANDCDFLDAFDLVTDGTIVKIDPSELFNAPEAHTSFEGFESLFKSSPQKTKSFFIGGHGEIKRPGGLTTENYLKFLSFLSKQQCQGLTLSTCYGGGKSANLHLVEEQKDLSDLKVKQPFKGCQFPVIICSIGEFVSDRVYDILIHQKMVNFLKSSEDQTLFKLQQQVKKERAFASPSLIYFPSSSLSPAGFRSFGEEKTGYSMTYHHFVKRSLEMDQSDKKGIFIHDTKLLELYPLIIDRPLIFEVKAPKIVSMIAGKAHHCLEKIQLRLPKAYSVEPLQFLKENKEYYQEKVVGVKKGFFIGQLDDGISFLEGVSYVIDANAFHCYYKQGGQYYYWNGEMKGDKPLSKPISPLQYALGSREIYLSTKPEDKAVRAATGGQQGDDLLCETILESANWKSGHKDVDELLQLIEPDNIKNLTKSEFNAILSSTLKSYSDGDKEAVTFYLLRNGRSDLVKEMFESMLIDSNAKEITGYSMAMAAAMHEEWDLLRFLLDKGADVNTKDPISSLSLLHLAIIKKHPIVDELLSRQDIDIECVDKRGLTPIFFVVEPGDFNSKVFEILKAKGVNFNVVDNIGYPLLNYVYDYSGLEGIKKYIKLNVNLNLGDPPPLIQAIYNYDKNTFAELLAAGADLYLPSKSENIPMFEAITRGSSEIVKMVIEDKKFDPNCINSKGITPLILAIREGHEKDIKLLIKHGAHLPNPFTSTAGFEVSLGIQRMKTSGNFLGIIALLENEKGECKPLESIVVNRLKDSHPELIQEWEKSGLLGKKEGPKPLEEKKAEISVKSSSQSVQEPTLKPSVSLNDFANLITLASKNVVKYKDEIAKIITSGFDCNQLLPDSKYSPSLIPCFNAIIGLGDSELVDLCLKHGASVNPPPQMTDKPIQAPLVAAFEVKEKDKNRLIFKKLVENKANFKQAKVFEIMTGEWIPLMARIIQEGNLQFIKDCFDQGVTLETDREQLEALKGALASQNVNIVKFLKEKGIKAVPELIDEAMLLAIAYGMAGAAMMDEFLDLSKEPKLSPLGVQQFWGMIIMNGDIETFRKLCRFKSFIKNNERPIQMMANHFQKPEFIHIMNESQI